VRRAGARAAHRSQYLGMRSSIILAVLCAAMKGCYGLDNGVALTPPRGAQSFCLSKR
jgi:hypothetical protein